ncbi:unnamed protein product, partial [Mesorhabditis belari]|uniref:Small ribosomal subunit protein mS39 n=1 Tax=Mesorhabditis belari TaxID=2138241 RepID=A0AAF3J953_9BILA
MHRFNVIRGLSNLAPNQLNIQPAIKRSPTALLEALASTVGTDPTAPHFSFIDDPAMIPTTPGQKRNYYLAKELGRRAARQLAEEWPTLFAFDREFPRMNAFRPQKELDPALMDPNEQNLWMLIEKRQVKDATILYEKIREKDINVSEGVKKDLFFLLAYYGGENVPFYEELEWHGLRTFGEADPPKWKDDVISLLYESIEQTPEVKSAMICGIIKHTQSTEKANQLFQEILSSGATPCVEAFNAVMGKSQFSLSLKLLQKMNQLSIKPNVNTFNALLESNMTAPLDKRQKTAMKILGEMKLLKIHPTLLTYNHLLNGIVKIRTKDADNKDFKPKEDDLKLAITVLNEIMTRIAGETYESNTLNDHHFFLTAMSICLMTKNVEIAQKVVQFYESPNNKVKAPEFTFENSFYNKYLQLFIDTTGDLKEIERVYKEYVPNRVGVSRFLIIRLINRLRNSDNWSFIKRLTEDGICAQMLTDARVSSDLRLLLKGINYSALSPTEREEYSQVVHRIVNALVEYSEFNKKDRNRLQQKLYPSTIIECACLLTKIGEENKAIDLLRMLVEEEDVKENEVPKVVQEGQLKIGLIQELFDHALRQKNTDFAAFIFEIMSRDLPRAQLKLQAQRMTERCRLNGEQTRILEGFVRLRPE